jgi:hypothetical protein
VDGQNRTYTLYFPPGPGETIPDEGDEGVVDTEKGRILAVIMTEILERH